MKIAVLSDTHGLLRDEVIEIIKSSDAVIHGGDINSQKILDKIKSVMKPSAELFVVRGNNDKEWAEYLPEFLDFELTGIKFALVHNRRDLPDTPDADIIIFGHTHKYFEERIDGRLWLNPGSCGKRRFTLPVTMAVLHTDGKSYSVEKIDIENGAPAPKNTLQTIKDIMKLMDKGSDVDAIAKRLGIDREFVRQIAMIRVTHPGVTAEGIMNKIEVNDVVVPHR